MPRPQRLHVHSLEVYRCMLGLFTPRAKRILDLYRERGPMTDRQVMQKLGYTDMNAVRPRISSLVEAGWLVRWNKLPSNPVDRLIRPKRITRLQAILSLTEIAALEALDLPPSEAAMRGLFLYTGLRRGGLIGLDWRDLDLEGSWVRLREKGASWRVLGLTAGVVVVLRDYLLAIGPQEPVAPVFRGNYGSRIDRRVVTRIVRRWGERIGRPDLHPKLLRHTYATYFTAKHGLAAGQDALGHKDPKTTRIYAQAMPTVLGEAMRGFRYEREQD